MSETKKATFAGGCFWCIESAFSHFPGVVRATSGLTGGTTPNPTYESVHTGNTGHREAVLVEYDPKKVTYEKLLEQFWRQIDPTDPGGQFADRGKEYATAIYYHDGEQRKLAEKSKGELEKSGKFKQKIVTEILPAKEFFEADEYHQGYAEKNPLRYKLYKKGSGRERYVKETWG